MPRSIHTAWALGVVNGVLLAMLGVLLFLWVAGCDQLDTAATFVEDHGTVYVCDTDQGCGERDEFCWNGSRAELEKLLGASCHAEGVEERAWPAIVGCAYCCGDGCGAGANAHCGSFCP